MNIKEILYFKGEIDVTLLRLFYFLFYFLLHSFLMPHSS
jgi:hypothetical protein